MLDATEWEKELSTDPCTRFYSIFWEYLELTCPVIEKKEGNKKKLNTWMTGGLLKSRKTKITLHRQAIREGNELWSKYRIYKNLYNKTIRGAKKLEFDREMRKNSDNARRLWEITNEYIGRPGKKKDAEIEEITREGRITRDKQTICDTMNKFFGSIGKELVNAYDDNNNYSRYLKPNQTYEPLTFQEVTEEQVLKTINSLKPKKSRGHDEISNWLLKTLKEELTTPLTIIINHGIRTKSFPQEWKIARIVPIFKKGEKTEPGNYRPISLLPCPSKIFEKIIEKQIREHLAKNNLIFEDQYGFRSNHETSNAVEKAIDYINEARKRKEASICIFMDIKKAFDSVHHGKLLKKLGNLGIETDLLKSYLEKRQQRTEIGELKSILANIEVGVPQGSILGPLLFLIYINDMPNSTEMRPILFADDTTLLLSGRNTEELIANANLELKK